jgi:hypothetical protein
MSPALLRADSIPLLRKIASKRLTLFGVFVEKYAGTRYRCRGATVVPFPCRGIIGLVFLGGATKVLKPEGGKEAAPAVSAPTQHLFGRVKLLCKVKQNFPQEFRLPRHRSVALSSWIEAEGEETPAPEGAKRGTAPFVDRRKQEGAGGEPPGSTCKGAWIMAHNGGRLPTA